MQEIIPPDHPLFPMGGIEEGNLVMRTWTDSSQIVLQWTLTMRVTCLTVVRNVKKETASSWGADYQKVLTEAMGMKRSCILSFKNKPPPPQPPPSVNLLQETSPFSPKFKSSKPLRYISVSQVSERTLDAPRLVEYDYLNVLDWGSSNTLAIGLDNDVHLLAESDGTVSELLSTDDVIGPVTGVRWAPDGRHIAVGFINSEVQLWDASAYQLGMEEVWIGTTATFATNYDIPVYSCRDATGIHKYIDPLKINA